jgi:hypothetical protein
MSDCTIAYLVHHHSASACKDQDKRANAFGVSLTSAISHSIFPSNYDYFPAPST